MRKNLSEGDKLIRLIRILLTVFAIFFGVLLMFGLITALV